MSLPKHLARIGRHLVADRARVRRAFSNDALARIEAAIQSSEQRHGGQIRFVVEGALDGRALFAWQSASARALEVFSQLRVWDTEANNGVLIYLLLADRDVEIVADRGIHARVGEEGWQAICKAMEVSFARGEFERGVLDGIASVTAHLARHFPPGASQPNELPDAPVVM